MKCINIVRAWVCLLAEALDAFRIVPRIIIIVYGIFVWRIGDWFMGLPDPTTQHTFFVSTVVGAAAAIIGLYQNSGRKWGDVGLKVWPFTNKNQQTLTETDEDSKK